MAVFPIAPAYRYGSSSTPTETAPVGASQTITKGDILVAASGYVNVDNTDPTTATIVGVARRGATTGAAGSQVVEYTPAMPDVIFEGTLRNSATGDYALTAADRFKSYGVEETAGGVAFVDQADTTNTRVRIVGFKDPVGTVDARVYFVFLSSATIYE